MTLLVIHELIKCSSDLLSADSSAYSASSAFKAGQCVQHPYQLIEVSFPQNKKHRFLGGRADAWPVFSRQSLSLLLLYRYRCWMYWYSTYWFL